MKSHTLGGLGYVVVALASLSAAPLFAQTAPPSPTPPPAPANANAGRALESATPPQPREIKKDANVLPPTDAPRAAAGDNGPTLLVKGFQVTGNTIFTSEELLALVKPWVGKPAGTDQLLDAAEAIKNRYKDAGFFLTQVFVPAQEVPDGVVTLRVLEARIGETHAEVNTQRVAPAIVDGYMRLLPKGAAVTEQNVERPLLLLNDLPGLKVSSVLRPGAETGEADLLVKVNDEGKTFGGDAYVDNAGNESTGYARVGADLVANGLLGQGESWTLGGLATEHNGVDIVRGGVTAPVGPYGTKATFALTYLHYNVLKLTALDADGYAAVASLNVQHPVIRSRNFNLFAVGGGDVKQLDDRTQGGSNHNKRRLYLGHLGVTGDFRDEYFGGSLNSFTLTLSAGDNRIGNESHALENDQKAGFGHKTNGTFEHLDGDYQRLQAITETTSVLVSMRGQLAFQNLDSSEKSSLGGPHGVRAFAVGDGVGDDVFLGTVELRQRVPAWTLLNAPFVLSAFVDGGRYKNWHDPISGSDTDNVHTLGGYGVGLNLTSRDDFQFRLDIARRINKGKFLGSDNRETRAWASLQKWF